MSDPRPTIDTGAEPVVVGSRCASCGYPLAVPRPICPVCTGDLAPARFGPGGTVFAATVIRIPVGDLRPPYALAYIDLDAGPRILARVSEGGGDVAAPAVGTRVVLRGTSPLGDPLVEVAA
jgi:hypothetical protein